MNFHRYSFLLFTLFILSSMIARVSCQQKKNQNKTEENDIQETGVRAFFQSLNNK